MGRDAQFYMYLVTIKVEDRLFRIPRQSLESQSKIFRDMFSLPVPVTEDAEGLSDENPIRLDGVTKDEFKRFLEVLFMGPWETPEPCATSQIFESWFPVVRLARMWEFDTIHKYAIKNMPYSQVPKTSAEKVGLAVHYDIHPWLLPGLNELAQRREPLGNDDLKLLGPELALKVAAVRESLAIHVNRDLYRHQHHSELICGSRDASTVDFTSVIRRVFRLPGDTHVQDQTPNEGPAVVATALDY